jgi:hypothetical protein
VEAEAGRGDGVIGENVDIRWGPLPGTPQELFFDDDTPDAALLFCGGWGAGKSMTLAAKMLKLSAINAPLPGIWIVPQYDHIRTTILPLLESVDPETGEAWFLHPNQYHYHKTEHTLTWAGGQLWFKSAEHAAAIAGPSVAFAGVDEPGSIEERAWKNTVARVRNPGAKLRQTVASGTPEGLNWMMDYFFDPERPDRYKVYRMATTENTALPPNYLAQVSENATEAEIQSYVEGKPSNLTGALAYPMFDERLHWIATVAPNPHLPLVLAFDFNVNPMVCIVGQTVAGPAGPEAHVIDAVVLYGGSTVDQTCDEILKRYPSWAAGVIVYGDATGKSRHVKSLRSNYDMIRDRLRLMVRDPGLFKIKVRDSNPPVVNRVNAVNRLLKDATGRTRLWLRKTEPARTCYTRELVRSLQRTKKKDDGDIEKKSGETITHAAEALGYWIEPEWPVTKPDPYVGYVR